MTTNTHADLMERHQAMQAQLASQPDTLNTDTILQFLAEAQATGATISDVRQREQLRAILRHWGGIAFDRLGEYPATQLAPFEGQPPSPLPPEGKPVNPPFSRWRLVVVGIGVIVGLFLLVAIASFFGVNAGGFLPMAANVVITVITEVVTTESVSDVSTPTPPAPVTPPEGNQGEASGGPEDTDGDGLNDEEEAIYGTNPFAEDSDGDGLWDIEEVELGTDPLAFDSDGDGLLDGEDDEPNLPSTPTPVPTETPTPQTAVPHTVQAGESLETIAEQYSVSVTQLTAMNDLSLQAQLETGQQLFIPLNPSFIVPELVIKISIVNLRSGPGIEYSTIGFPERGTFATVLGQTVDPTWYLVEMQDGKGTRGWLSAAVVRLLYPTRPENIPPVATVPPTPAP